MTLYDLKNNMDSLETTSMVPLFFIGHGNPMNAIANNTFTKSLRTMGLSLQDKPKVILVISAHWLTQGTHVMVSAKPRTIHDFGGFPEELYQVQYPAPGAPEYAREACQSINSTNVIEDHQWGLDHGAWSVLRHMFPEAAIPVFQLSIDYSKPARYHYNLAQELISLRKKGVLIIGSGNIVHNLYQIDFNDRAKPFDWAVEFDELVKTKLVKKDYDSLLDYSGLGEAALLSVPTNDHYLPMIYALGLAHQNEELTFTYEEIQNASISMRCFRLG